MDVNPEAFKRQKTAVEVAEELDGVLECPACASKQKHTFRGMPFGEFVYRVFWCKSVLDFDGLHVSNKCNSRVRAQEEKAERAES